MLLCVCLLVCVCVLPSKQGGRSSLPRNTGLPSPEVVAACSLSFTWVVQAEYPLLGLVSVEEWKVLMMIQFFS